MTEIANWLDMAPADEPARRDYFVRLIALLACKVSKEQMQAAIRGALEPRCISSRTWN